MWEHLLFVCIANIAWIVFLGFAFASNRKRASSFNRNLFLHWILFGNSAIHLGEIVQNERREIFHAFLASTSMMVDEMDTSRQEFFGEYADLVSTHLDQSTAEVNLVVAEKIARAQICFQNKYGALEPAHAGAIVELV